MSEQENGLERKALRKWRTEVGLSQVELAELAGTTKSSVSDIELGGRTVNCESGTKLARALDIEISQIVAVDPVGPLDASEWGDEGFSDDAPRKSLLWWREYRSVAQKELARVSGVSHQTIRDIEAGRTKRASLTTRRKLAQALKVSPSKLLFAPIRSLPEPERSQEEFLRGELRESRRANKKFYDFVSQDPAITFRYQDARDALLKDVGPALKGL